MKKSLIAIAMFVLVGISAYYYLSINEDKTTVGAMAYTNADLGIEFDYPSWYVVQESTPADPAAGLVRSVVLIHADDYASVANPPIGGEGPPTITLTVFTNEKNQFPLQWAEEHVAYSNINLKMGDVRETVVGGANAIRYMADGLYASDNVVVAHGDHMYVFTGMYLDADSALKRDFDPIVGSLRFIPTPGQAGDGVSSVALYFQDRMITLGIENFGRPIEGFDAGTLMRAFPGLVASDFQNVEALEGHYAVEGNEVSFVRGQSQTVSSAEGMVSEVGYETLLKNLSARLAFSVTSNASVDELVQKISASERLEARIGQGVSALRVQITPREILEDSRCPLDVVCIQAGTVRARATFEHESGTEERVFELGKAVVMGKVAVTLVEVAPAPRSTVTLKPSDYRFYFKIQKQ